MAGADRQRLRQARRHAGLTLAAAAERTGISAGAISNWENGHRQLRDIDKIRRLAVAYGVRPDWLTGLSDLEWPLDNIELRIIQAWRTMPEEFRQWLFQAMRQLLD